MMSLARERIEAAGPATAVPEWSALAQVQDKVSAFATLTRVGLPQPAAVVAATAAELEDAAELGLPGLREGADRDGVGRGLAGHVAGGAAAAGGGVRRPGAFRRGAAGQGGVLVQRAVAGPLVMVQSVFARGELVAWHACQAGPRGRLGWGQPQAQPGPAGGARAPGPAGCGA